jgi:hypothetical protein
MATIGDIKQRLELIRQELAEVCAAVDEIARQPGAPTPLPQEAPVDLDFADKEPLRRAFDELLTSMGIVHVRPVGALRLQEMMLAAGVKPEENLFSRGIIDMREE